MTWLLNPFRFGNNVPSAFADAFDLWWAKDLDSGDMINQGTNPDAATHTLDPVASPTHTAAGKFSKFTLNGTSQYFEAPNTAQPGFTFTVVSVFVTENYDNRVIFGKSGDGTAGAADLRIGTSGKLRMRVTTTSADGPDVTLSKLHVASVRRDGSGNDEVIRLDGTEVNVGTVHPTWNESSPWYFGARYAASAGGRFLDGEVYLLAYWKRELTTDELDEIEAYFDDAATGNELATGGTITTDTDTSVVHEFSAGGTFSLDNLGILPVSVTITGTGTFGSLSATGDTYVVEDTTVTVTSGTVTVEYNPTKFVPASGFQVWYDAAKASTITSSGGNVSAWADRSPAGNDLTGTSNPRTGDNTINSLNTISLNGTSYLKRTSTSALADDASIVLVAKKTGANNTFEAVPITFTAGNAGRPFDGYNDSRIIATTNKLSYNNVRTWTTAKIVRLLLEQDGVSSGNHSVTQWVNGTLDKTDSNNGTWSTTSQAITVGGRDDGATHFRGDIGEIIAANAIWTDAQVDTIQGYLSDKWGVSI